MGLCWAILGLCWALLAAFGLKISKYGSVEVEFWVGFGHVELVLGHLVALWGKVSGGKKEPSQKVDLLYNSFLILLEPR